MLKNMNHEKHERHEKKNSDLGLEELTKNQVTQSIWVFVLFVSFVVKNCPLAQAICKL